MKTLICDCNHTMPLDAPALQRALARTTPASPDGLETPHTLLCRREAAAFQRAAKATAASGEELVVACTQERRLFLELNAQTAGCVPAEVRPIRFVNIRETGGWSRDAALATPKIAALLAQAQLPAPEPVPQVSYRSAGRCLILGAPQDAERAAALLADRLDVSLLLPDDAAGSLQQDHAWAVHRGRLRRLAGWLGAFDVEWESAAPIDLDLCTRCNACIVACPEGAIDFGYRVDLARCTSHRDCVRACEAPGAIDFERAPRVEHERFDLVLDLHAQPAFTLHQPPQGYFHAADAPALQRALLELRDALGEFEKPRFFAYQHKLCAHSRNERIGCRACIDVCSAQAITSDASLKGRLQGKARGGPNAARGSAPAPSGGIVVEPHLCVGCGACSTVCPSGAIGYAYPAAPALGQRVQTMLAAFAAAGGRDAALLFHSEAGGTRAIDALGRAARTDRAVHGVPARVLPLAVHHVASVGLDVWLAAIAQGASQVWLLATDEEAPAYRDALAQQMALAEALLAGLGYRGRHVALVDGREVGALDAALREPPATSVAQPAAFHVQAGKRATLELAIEHLVAQAPRATQLPDEITLPAAGSPFGSLVVDTGACTMCLACVGACPSGALLDNPERPQLRFIEKNCVQCGLCEGTCPEHAITLQPRLWLADGGRARKAPRVLHEMEPFACVRCGKPFGTLRAVEAMAARLAGHAAFQGAAAARLRMCSDCRIIDLHSAADEVKITSL